MTKKQRNRRYHEILQDLLKILKEKFPNTATSYDLENEGKTNLYVIKRYMKDAEEKGLVDISSKMYGTRKVTIYSITQLGIKVTEAWDRYQTDLCNLGIEDLIVSVLK